MDFAEAMRHAGGESFIPAGALEDVRGYMPHYLWINDHAEGWDDSGYFMDQPGQVRRFHCEMCNREWEEERTGSRWKVTYRQNEVTACPMCGGKVIAKHMGRGFFTLRHQMDAVVYGRSHINPEALVAYAVHCERDYGGADTDAPWTLDTEGEVRGIAVLICGEGAWRYDRKVAEWEINGGMAPASYRWVAVKSMNAMNFGTYWLNSRPERVVLSDSLEAAMEGTPFERAWRDEYLMNDANQDGLAALALIAKYPCVEYLTKLGCEDFVCRKLRGQLPAGLINWRGRSMAAVMRLSPSRLGEIKGQRIPLTVETVAVLQVAEKCGLRVGAKLAEKAGRAFAHAGRYAVKALREALALFPDSRQTKALKYIARQANRATAGDIADYWQAVAELGGTLAAGDEAFPADFWAAHDRIVARRRAARHVGYDAAIQKRYRRLDKKYGFTFGGLVLRPAMSAAEVIGEGEALHHCVAGYVDKYAEGGTNIFVLRRAVEPDTPWRTVEIGKDGRVIQDRGLYNDGAARGLMDSHYRQMLDLFWAAWKERKTA